MRKTKRHRTALNFIDRYGIDAFKEMLDMIGKGVSGQDIANRLQVSRERVRQWKNTFGESVFFYRVHPEISHILKGERK